MISKAIFIEQLELLGPLTQLLKLGREVEAVGAHIGYSYSSGGLR